MVLLVLDSGSAQSTRVAAVVHMHAGTDSLVTPRWTRYFSDPHLLLFQVLCVLL